MKMSQVHCAVRSESRSHLTQSSSNKLIISVIVFFVFFLFLSLAPHKIAWKNNNTQDQEFGHFSGVPISSVNLCKNTEKFLSHHSIATVEAQLELQNRVTNTSNSSSKPNELIIVKNPPLQ